MGEVGGDKNIMEKLQKSVDKVLETIAPKICSGYSTCTVENYNSQRAQLTPKHIDYWKYLGTESRADASALIRNLGWIRKFGKRILLNS